MELKTYTPRSPPNWPSELLAVPGRDDVRLNRVFRRIRRIAGDDAPFVKRALAQIGVRRAAIATASEDDRTFLPHRAPTPSGKGAFVIRAQVAGRRVAAPECVFRRSVVLEYRRDERGSLARIARVFPGLTCEEARLEIGHDPRT